jgi:hypothetical protein
MHPRVPALPFVNWLNREEYEFEQRGDTSENLAALLGVEQRTTYRYKRSLDSQGKPTETFDRAAVEDMLHHAGVAPWELGATYAAIFTEEPEVHEGFCSRCDETVLTTDDRRCLWCGTLTTTPMTVEERRIRTGRECPACGGEKMRGAVLCKGCREVVGQPGRGPSDPRHLTCPECGGRKTWRATVCRTCWITADRNVGKRSRRAPTLITERQLEEARRLYEDGCSIRMVAEAIFPDSGYATLEACKTSLRSMFRARGWKLRSKSEAMKLAYERRLAAAAVG